VLTEINVEIVYFVQKCCLKFVYIYIYCLEFFIGKCQSNNCILVRIHKLILKISALRTRNVGFLNLIRNKYGAEGVKSSEIFLKNFRIKKFQKS